MHRQYVDGRFGQIHLRIAGPAAKIAAGPTENNRADPAENNRAGQAESKTAAPASGRGSLPLLCLHMSPNSSRIYQTFVGQMGVDRLTVAPDTPGFGESDPPAEQPAIADYAAAMLDVMDALGLAQVDVMGYHTGSETCVELAHQAPDRIRKLVLTSAPIFNEDELDDFRTHYAKPELTEDGSHVAEKWRAYLHWAGPGWTLQHVAEQFADALRRPDIAWWGHNAAFDYPMKEKLEQVQQPVLVLNPNDDLVEHSRRAHGLLQNGRIHELPDWGHGFLDVHTAEACALVRQFLDGEVNP
ncbi:MAG: alpha/beta fold hydrolase [Rhodospirillaceae bacterium]